MKAGLPFRIQLFTLSCGFHSRCHYDFILGRDLPNSDHRASTKSRMVVVSTTPINIARNDIQGGKSYSLLWVHKCLFSSMGGGIIQIIVIALKFWLGSILYRNLPHHSRFHWKLQHNESFYGAITVHPIQSLHIIYKLCVHLDTPSGNRRHFQVLLAGYWNTSRHSRNIKT